jgi:hypothetical protein
MIQTTPAPAFLAWVREVQMPALAQRLQYQQQFADRGQEGLEGGFI